jgi:hypothetical protein
MSAIGSVGSVSVQQILAQQSQAKAGGASKAEEQAESPAQEAAEHDGGSGGLDVRG